MPCDTTRAPDGGTVIICSRGPRASKRPRRCECGAPATRLCDAPRRTAPDRTCDRPVCDEHVVRVGEADYCVPHAPRVPTPVTVTCPDCGWYTTYPFLVNPAGILASHRRGRECADERARGEQRRRGFVNLGLHGGAYTGAVLAECGVPHAWLDLAFGRELWAPGWANAAWRRGTTIDERRALLRRIVGDPVAAHLLGVGSEDAARRCLDALFAEVRGGG